jgi:hypothetical protein
MQTNERNESDGVAHPLGANYGDEYMQNLHLQFNPVFIPMTSRVIILDFRLRISD